MITLIKSSTESELNWTTQIAEGGFTSDDLINAYIKGAQDHAKHAKREIEKKFNENLQKAQDYWAAIIESLIEEGYEIKYARLKFNTIECFKIILFVSRKLFLSDKILELYNVLSGILPKINDESFHVSFNIMPDNGNLNEQRLMADGYTFTYGKQQ